MRPRLVGDDERLMYLEDSAYVLLGAIHRLENPSDVDVELIEVQCGNYLGEDDIVRLDDIYGRL